MLPVVEWRTGWLLGIQCIRLTAFLHRRRFPHRQAFLAVSVLCVFSCRFLTKAARSFASAAPTDSAALAKPVLCASFGIPLPRHSYRTFLRQQHCKICPACRRVSRVSDASPFCRQSGVLHWIPCPATPPERNASQHQNATQCSGESQRTVS